jgi:transposase
MARRARCTGCGVAAIPHAQREHLVRDIPAHGRPVLLVWHKRIWHCAEPGCPKRTWTEANQAVATRSALTERASTFASLHVLFPLDFCGETKVEH